MRTILIGGTGRCGTNLLKNIFTNHSSVVTLPFEQRFFIDRLFGLQTLDLSRKFR